MCIRDREDVIGPSMQGGDYPDVIHLATGREAALTLSLIHISKVADGIREWDVRRAERGPFGCDFSTYLGDQKPVSYTHLDVYKRQQISSFILT